MIASVALRAHAVLLAHDADLDRLAKVVGIESGPALPSMPEVLAPPLQTVSKLNGAILS